MIWNEFTRRGPGDQSDSENEISGEFAGTVVKEVCTLLDTDQENYISYDPAAAGHTEQMKRTIKTELRKGVNATGSNWDEV